MGDCNDCAFLKCEVNNLFRDWSCKKGHDPVCVMRRFLKYCPDYESWGEYHAKESIENLRKKYLKPLKEKQEDD